MATVTGAMTSTNVLSNQLAIDISKQISLLEPDVQPLAVFSRAANKEATVATKFRWLEDEAKARFDTTNGTLNTTETALTVSNGIFYQQWDQVLNTRTGEQVRVDGVSGNVVTLTRGIGSTATAGRPGRPSSAVLRGLPLTARETW